MPINFSKLTTSANRASLEPRDIFMALPSKDTKYSYPRDVQTEVWKQWFPVRNNKNLIIKMNTGSGKTVVGLTILQSCLNEGKGPAVYIAPDNYLVTQVCAEAKKLGIRVSCDKYDDEGTRIENGEQDYYFRNKSAIYVTNIHRLVNGKSIFGLRSTGNVQIGSIVIDDVHACLDSIEQQYTVKIGPEHALYAQITNIFSKYQELQDNKVFHDITAYKDPRNNKLIPFWIWQKSCEDIRRLMQSEYPEDSITQFNLPLLVDNWETCNCVVSARSIEITPKCIPISKISSFEQAERRIFMSATLADDSVLVSTMGLKKNEIGEIITPEKANDIGERLILFPKHLNAALNDNCVKQKLIEIAQLHNVVVIVPSFERAKFWDDARDQVCTQVLSSHDKNIESGVMALKQKNFKGLTILINKYDGVDLPDDACRFLVIDGLPSMRSEYDSVVQEMNPGDRRICREHIQKIEQGMGRGVRSNNDYCIVVLMGDNLADVLLNQGGDKYFSNSTLEQYNISKQLWEQLMESGTKPNIEEVFALADYTLMRDKEWISISRGALASVEYAKSANVDSTVVAIRNAFDKESIGRYEEASRIIEAETNENSSLDDKTKGWLKQFIAEYMNFSNPVKAQEILSSAQNLNSGVLKPINGIQYEKSHSDSSAQANAIQRFLDENGYTPNNYVIHLKSVLDNLIFTKNQTNSFEQAINDIASAIGINASRPDRDGVPGGPDNLWCIDNLEYFVIECKSGVEDTTMEISKSDCAQLLSSIQWFENQFAGNSFTCYPIIIHRTNRFEAAASPDPRMRVMTVELLEKFKHAVKSFAEGAATGDVLNNTQEIQQLLKQYCLTGKTILNSYTISARQ